MKKLFGVLVLMLVVWPLSPAGATNAGTFKDGPYASTSIDSGSCGPDWAWDLFNRKFAAKLPGSGGTYHVTETFAKGKFKTIAGVSPGACGDGDHGLAVKGGIGGNFSGTLGITVTDGVFNEAGTCQLNGEGQCGTGGWIHGYFGDDAKFTIDTFKFTYTAENQGLIFGKWVNSGTGSTGDIATS